MGPHNWVTTTIRCARHHRDCATICLRVDREVPDPLRCSPGGGTVGGTGGGTTSLLDCPCGGRFDTADLSHRTRATI